MIFPQLEFEKVLANLISFQTLSGENNIDLINYIQKYLEQYNIDCFFTGKDLSHKKNLYAVINPPIKTLKQTKDSNGLLLSGHTDIVGIKGQQWLSNPFELRIINNKYYGRGTCDMKGYLALILCLVPEFLKLKLQKPLYLAFTYDEETTYEGVRYLTNSFKNSNLKPELAIVGEPSELSVISAHKGDSYLECEVFGLASHSSTPNQGTNAIYYAAQLITELEKIAKKNTTLLKKDFQYNPPYSTLSIGTIEGGSAVNTVPDYCRFQFECRTIYDSDLTSILTRLEQKITQLNKILLTCSSTANIKLKKHYSAPPLSYQDDSQVIRLIKKYIQNQDNNFASFGTEAGYYQQVGISTAIWGPGSISQAHKSDEYIELSQVQEYAKSLLPIITDYCT